MHFVAHSQGTSPLVAYSLDENSGTTVTDNSGNGNGGTIFGAAWSSQGRYGSALSFDGVDDRVRATTITLGGSFTLMAWINKPLNPAYATIVTVGGNRDFYLGSGVLAFYDGSADRLFGSALSSGTWHHVAIVSDGSTLRAYLNGAPIGSTYNVALGSYSGSIQVGAWIYGTNNVDFFNGTIDEVRIYNRALTQTEIQTDMNTPISQSGPDVTPPVRSNGSPSGTLPAGTTQATLSLVTNENASCRYATVAGTSYAQMTSIFGTTGGLNHSTQVSGLVDGQTYNFYVRCQDGVGNANPDDFVISFSINAPPPPRLTITQPANGSTVIGTTVTVTYAVSGDLTEADHAHFSVDAGPEFMDMTLDGNYQLTNVPLGTHTLLGMLARANHSDIAGSESSVSFTNIDTADNIPPTVTMTSPSDGATVSGIITLSADASDNVGVAGVQFRVDSLNVGAEDTSASYSIQFDTIIVSNGSHAVTAVARDAAGNQAVSTPVVINVSNNPSTDPSQIGQWSSVLSWPIVAVHMIQMYTGEILIIDDVDTAAAYQVWNPTTNTFTTVPYSGNDLFCGGHATLSDGNVLIVGGGQVPPVTHRGAALFDPATRTWTTAPTMAFARWYPTATTLADGRVLVVSGSDTSGNFVTIPEIYDPQTNSWSQLSGASLSVPLYPFMFVLPSGAVAQAGSDDTPTQTRMLDLGTQTWTTVDARVLPGGSAVMYEAGQILKSGLEDDVSGPIEPAIPNTYIIDMNQPSPLWRQVGNMNLSRAHHNLVALPDGSVLVVGGARSTGGTDTSQAVYEAEIWNPQTETWRVLARMQTPRLYHSTALLLPDGRVVVAGGGRWGPDQFSAEIYSPSYLFRGARPAITSVQPSVEYGRTFLVETPDAQSISRVSLIRLGAVTHSFDQDQRQISLTFTQTINGLDVQAPPSGNYAPPGYYMLFIVNSNGIPSVARIVRLSSSNQPPQITQATATPTSGAPPLGVAFAASATDAENDPLTYQWDFGDGATSNLATTTHTYLAAGRYTARLSVSDGANQTLSAPIYINVGTPPTATIVSPSNGATFRGGDIIVYSGSATDPEETLTGANFSWTILFHHETHVHPEVGPITGSTSGAFQIPVSGHSSEGNTSFEIILTVTDSTGLQNTVSVYIFPQEVNLTFDTLPTGLTLTLDGVNRTTPLTLDTLIGFQHTIGAPNQTQGAAQYSFVSWSDGGAQTHTVVVPASAQSYVATYQLVSPPPPGLVAAYSFNEGSGTTVTDLSLNGNTGTISGATWVLGRYGNGLQFDGIDDWVTVADANSLDLTNGMTIEAWVFPAVAPAGWRTVVVKERPDNLGYYLQASSRGQNRPATGVFVSNAERNLAGTSRLAANTWVHLAATWDGAVQRLYVNGVQVASRNQTGSMPNSAGLLRIGGNLPYGEFFQGLIDEVRIYNRALTLAEIQADMNTPLLP